MVVTAQSMLFYGLSIKTLSLCFAVDAHKATQGIQVALDIIKLRKQQGFIKVSILPKTVTRIPEEVWQLIKEQVVDQALLDAEEAILTPFCGPGEVPPSLDVPWHLESDSTRRRDHFWNKFVDRDGSERVLRNRIKEIQNLLGSFGLVLPHPYPLYYGELDTANNSFESLVAIALPLRVLTSEDASPSTSYPILTVTDQFAETNRSMNTLAQFSSSTFSLTADPNARFKRFLSTFNLKAQNAAPPVVYPPSAQPQRQPSPDPSMSQYRLDRVGYDEREAWETAESRKAHAAVCCSSPVVQPHWSLLTVARDV